MLSGRKPLQIDWAQYGQSGAYRHQRSIADAVIPVRSIYSMH